jgi:hypothetical protein
LLPYLKKKRMSREKCNYSKIFHTQGAEAVLDDSNGRHPASQPNKPRPPRTGRSGAMPTFEKSTNEWVKSRFEAAGSHRKWDRRSS